MAKRPRKSSTDLGKARKARKPRGRMAAKPRNSISRGPMMMEHMLGRVASALERLAPAPPVAPDFAAADAFAWHPGGKRLAPVPRVNRVDMALLRGIDRVRDLLVENTERF